MPCGEGNEAGTNRWEFADVNFIAICPNEPLQAFKRDLLVATNTLMKVIEDVIDITK